MKRSELFFSVLLVPLDYLLVVVAAVSAYMARFNVLPDLIPVTYQLSMRELLAIAVPAALMWPVSFSMLGLYSIRLESKTRGELLKVLIGSTTAVTLFIFVIFFRQELFASRFIILATWVLSILYVGIGRMVIRLIQRQLIKKGIGARGLVLIVGKDDVHNLSKTFAAHPEFGYVIKGEYQDFNNEASEKMRSFIDDRSIDQVLMANPNLPPDAMKRLAEFCDENHLTLSYTTDFLPIPMTYFESGTIAGVPFIEIKRTRLDGWGKVWKRVFDIIIGCFCIIIFSPILLITALVVIIDSKGPVIVRLTRVGARGKVFTMYKFRSMVHNAEQLKAQLMQYNERKDGPLFKMSNDPRITRVGKFIRKTSLDELPQLFNVVQGNMSLVGPRPHEPQEVARYTKWQNKLLTIKPGMTGMAQISGRSDLRFEQEAELDIYYIENWSILLDFRILIKTAQVVIMRKGSA